MRIPTDHIDLADLGYEGYWIEMPRSIKEGFLHDFANLSNGNGEDADGSQARAANIKILELVTDWNIDDDDGKTLPLMKTLKDQKAKEKVVAELPVDLIVHIAQRMAGTVNVPEKTKDF